MMTHTRTLAGRMPGGGISRRPLHVLLMADCSGSMAGEKIQALNYAIAQTIQHLASWEEDQERAQVLVRAIAFADEPRWHVREPQPVARLRWDALPVVPGGRTYMGPAFRLAASVLGRQQMPRRAFAPALLLITDGMPSDDQVDFNAGLAELMAQRAGREALRMAVAIGQDARSDALTRFIDDPRVPVFVASDVDQIADQLRVATLAITGVRDWVHPGDQDTVADGDDVPV